MGKKWKFVSNLLKQFRFDTWPSSCFYDPNFFQFRIEASISDTKLRFLNESSNWSCNNKLEIKLWIWIVLTSWKQNFDYEKETSIMETKLQFWKQNSDSGNEASILETKGIFY